MEKRLKKYLKDGKFEGVTATTSKTMSVIRGKNNKTTEMKLKMGLVRTSISGFILHDKTLLGKPDFFFKKDRLAIFVDGCYWHGCPKCGHIPKTRSAFWKAKIDRNIQRDKKNRTSLIKLGIAVLRIWEHELKTSEGINKIIKKVKSYLTEGEYEKNFQG